MKKVKQLTSKDYDRLYELVVTHRLSIPCIIDYQYCGESSVFRDFASVSLVCEDRMAIRVGVRGISYSNVSNFCLNMTDKFSSLREIFIRDCQVMNLEFFDTVKEEE